MKIRPYKDQDKPAVTALWSKVFPITAPHHDPGLAIQRKLDVERDLFFVATQDSQIIGTVMGGYDGHRGWVYSLAVKSQLRRKGVATALMKHLEEALNTRGCPKINLQVLAANSEVVAFYKTLGYSVEDRVSMGKRVDR